MNKKLRKTLIGFSYLLVIATVLLATVVLVAIGQGYSYNFKTHEFKNQTGLLVLESSPSGANVYLKGKDIRRKTPYRTTLEAGEYDFEVRRDGYHTWKKHITITASQVSAIEYVVLVPTKLKSETISTEQPIGNLAASDDRRHFAYLTGGASPGVWTFNSDRRQSNRIYTARPASADQPAETLSSVVWSADGSHVLVRTMVGAVAHAVVVPANGGTAVDLTQLFKFDLTALQFSPNDWRELYWLSPEGIRRLNVEAQTVSAVLADKVSAFTLAGDRMFFVQSTPTGKAVLVSDRNGRGVKRLVQSLAESDSYELLYSNYRGKDWLAILAQKASTVTLYEDVFSATPVSKIVSNAAAHMVFSPEDSRYLAYYSPAGFGTYDLDKGRRFEASKQTTPLDSLIWFDKAHVITSRQGHAELAEFDGSNSISVMKAAPGSLVVGTNDLRSVIGLMPTSAADPTLHLVITDLRR